MKERSVRKAPELKIYQERGTWWMNYDGGITDHLANSTNRRWVAAYFPKLRGGKLVITDRQKQVLVFGCGFPDHLAVSDVGIAAVVEGGGAAAKPSFRTRLFYPDGATAIPKLPRKTGMIEGLTLSTNGSTCTVEYADRQRASVATDKLERRTTGKSIQAPSNNSGCLGLVLLFAACLIFVLIASVAQARLGETFAQCQARYGTHIQSPAPVGACEEMRVYSKGSYLITIGFIHGTASVVSYNKTDHSELSDNEQQALLAANQAASTWTKDRVIAIESQWHREDGEAFGQYAPLEKRLAIMSKEYLAAATAQQNAKEKRALEGF